MSRTGPRNAITDVAGLTVGQVDDEAMPTGTTVVVADRPVIASVDQRGGAPGTRELALLEPGTLVDRIDAVSLSGGSAYGLAAADGLMDALAADGRGYPVGRARVPIVPALILFDLALGPPERQTATYAALGNRAYAVRGAAVAMGSVGAGRGARTGGIKGGIGTASIVDDATGATVGAIAAVNAVGSTLMPGTRTFWAWPFERDGELGGQEPPGSGPYDVDAAIDALPGGNTTIVVVATDATLDVAQAQRFAIMAQDGLARAIRPIHTPFDGDTVIAMATERSGPVDVGGLARLGSHAADVVARAIARGVFEATSVADVPAYRDL